MDDFERIVAASGRGLFESHYLKVNDPTGERAIWIKHNALVPIEGAGLGEFWAIAFQRGEPPIVVKREVPWNEVTADKSSLALSCGDIALAPTAAKGAIAGIEWDLSLTATLPPLFHLPYSRLYTGGFPKKKLLTPAPNLRFDGALTVFGRRWPVEAWVGLRGHNWGSEHAHAYGYGSCNVWDDGAPDRTVEGFTGRILVGNHASPWLSSVVARNPDVRKNHLRHWLGAGAVTPSRWEAAWWRPRKRVAVSFQTDPAGYAGLRYKHPDGHESYCYSTKFADVSFRVGSKHHSSRCGELEVLFPEPLKAVPMHPSTDWDAGAGDYSSV